MPGEQFCYLFEKFLCPMFFALHCPCFQCQRFEKKIQAPSFPLDFPILFPRLPLPVLFLTKHTFMVTG